MKKKTPKISQVKSPNPDDFLNMGFNELVIHASDQILNSLLNEGKSGMTNRIYSWMINSIRWADHYKQTMNDPEKWAAKLWSRSLRR